MAACTQLGYYNSLVTERTWHSSLQPAAFFARMCLARVIALKAAERLHVMFPLSFICTLAHLRPLTHAALIMLSKSKRVRVGWMINDCQPQADSQTNAVSHTTSEHTTNHAHNSTCSHNNTA